MNPGFLTFALCSLVSHHWLSKVDFITIAGLKLALAPVNTKQAKVIFFSFVFFSESSSLMVDSGSYWALEWEVGDGGML